MIPAENQSNRCSNLAGADDGGSMAGRRIEARTLPGTRRLLAALVATTAMVLVAACGSGAQGGAGPVAPKVSVAPVLSKDIVQWDEFTGRVTAVETVELRPRVTGYIERVLFAEGQEVAKGAVLFEIDARSFRAEHERATAELARARSRVALTKSEATRGERLVATGAISSELFDQRKSAATQAVAEMHAAEAALSLARLNLDYTMVRAPIAGRAGRALVTVGNLATADQTQLTTVVSLDPVHVYFEGDESTYLRYNEMAREGSRPSSRNVRNPVHVGLANEEGFPHEGYVDFVDNQLDATTGTIRARAVLANADRVFTPGLFARVQLLGSASRPALLVDDKAILTDQDRKFVYVLGADNKAMRRDVELGRKADGLRVVASGLAVGELVIVHGVQKVFFAGMAVDPQRIAMGDPPPPPGTAP